MDKGKSATSSGSSLDIEINPPRDAAAQYASGTWACVRRGYFLGSVARKAVDSLTERQIDEACGKLPATGAGDWLSALWQFVSDNWLTILSALLPILLLLI